MKALLFSLLCLLATAAAAQKVIILQQDTFLLDTWVIDQDTEIIGRGFTVYCDDCDPVILAKPNVHICMDGVRFAAGYVTWMVGPDLVYRHPPRQWRTN